MILNNQTKNGEQNEEQQNRQRARSPSLDSLNRLHQQSGGFAPHQQSRRGSFSKENSFFHNNHHHQGSHPHNYRRQNYSQRGRNHPRNGNYAPQHLFDYQHDSRFYQKPPRNYQNYPPQHPPKNQFFYQNSYANQQRAIFNSTHEYGAFSVRRQSPSSPTSPNGQNGSHMMLAQRRDQDGSDSEHQQNDSKIHNYRAAGTAPGSFSNGSSPYKQQSGSQPPPTPSSDKQEEWRFPNAPPGLQNHRPAQNEHPATIKLQNKSQMTVENSMHPPTSSAVQYRASMKDKSVTRLTDNVDAKHPCFSDERMHSALYGVSPQVKSQHQPSGPPIVNEREAAITIEALQKMHMQQQLQMPRGPAIYPIVGYHPLIMECPTRTMKGKDAKMYLPPMAPGMEFQNDLVCSQRDSSTNSRCSSRATELEKQLEETEDLDKTTVGRSDMMETERKQGVELPVRKSAANRRDSECSTVSSTGSSSPTFDESTLTKILPTDEFRGGRGVPSQSPPQGLVSEPLSRMDVLSEKIWDYHNKVAQTDEMLQRKLHLRDMLYTAISPVFPMSGLYVVGSSLNGFGNNSSDMDLCLMITNKDLDQKNDAVVVLNLILSTLQYEKFVDSQKLILAKVPILRIQFAAPFDDITVDLNANNSVAIRNTHLLCYYSSYDWRVRPLVSVVKEWAKRKGINDANKSSFTSYSLVLMVIHYLQCGTEPRVLPNLQHAYPARFSNKVDVRTLNVTMPLEQTPEALLETTSPSERTTLGELLIGFLDYYANQFDYDHDAISIRQGQRVERAMLAARPKMHMSNEKETPPPSSSTSTSSLHNGSAAPPPPPPPALPAMHHSVSQSHFWRSQWRCVCIEEPFTNSNTAHSIYDEMVFGAIKGAFREAHAELEHNHDLDRLLECEPIKASTTNAGAAVFAATYEGERPLAQQPNSIATASLRAMTSIPPANSANGHFHYQQQVPQPQQQQQQQPQQCQVLKQQRGNQHNQQYQQQQQMHRGPNSNSNQSNHRRPYQSQGGPRSSRSNESFNKERSQHSQRTGAKENLMANGGKQQQLRKEDSTKTKRSLMTSPEPSSKCKPEKTSVVTNQQQQRQ